MSGSTEVCSGVDGLSVVQSCLLSIFSWSRLTSWVLCPSCSTVMKLDHPALASEKAVSHSSQFSLVIFLGAEKWKVVKEGL